MTDKIKTVTDKSQYGFLLDNFFKGRSVFIKTNSGKTAGISGFNTWGILKRKSYLRFL